MSLRVVITVGVVVVVIAIPVVYSLKRPDLERRTQWARILRRLPLMGGPSALLFLWTDMICDILSGWFVNFLFEGGFSQTGQHPDYRYAKNHRRDGEVKEAIAAIQVELRKDPKNFEGLLLLAEIYEDLNQPTEAIAQLNIILENPEATPEQKEVAQREQENCRRLQKHLEESEFLKQHNER